MSKFQSSKFPVRVFRADDKDVFPPEEGHVLNSPFADRLEVPLCSIDQYVWMNVEQWADKTAIVCGMTGRSYTYRQLRKACSALAFALQNRLGAQQHDVVAVVLPNIPEFGVVALGGLEAGCTLTLINPAYTPFEMANQLGKSKAKFVFMIAELAETAQKALQSLGVRVPIVVISSKDGAVDGDFVDFADLLRVQGTPKPYKCSVEDVAVMPSSSGTTGLPKLVQLTHLNYIVNCEQFIASMGDFVEIRPTTEDFQECLICILPFFHGYGFTVNLISRLHLGLKLVTLPRFIPDIFLGDLLKHKCTMLSLVPPLIIFLSNYDKATQEHFKYVRTVVYGAAPLSASDTEMFKRKASHVQFSQGYGMTEGTCVSTRQSFNDPNYATVGCPLPGSQVKIASLNDEKFVGLGPNQTGEIFLRGPNVMLGYLGNDETTRITLVSNKWLRTGDIGYYDDQGRIYITDRLKELIKVKGFQVAPAELEAILRSHPEILDAAVIGIPDPRCGEVPRAFVVRKSEGLDVKSVQDFVAAKVSEFKHLAGGVVFLEVIPKSSSGKILRRELKEKYLKNNL